MRRALLGQATSESRWLGHARSAEISSDHLRWAKVRAKVSAHQPPARPCDGPTATSTTASSTSATNSPVRDETNPRNASGSKRRRRHATSRSSPNSPHCSNGTSSQALTPRTRITSSQLRQGNRLAAETSNGADSATQPTPPNSTHPISPAYESTTSATLSPATASSATHAPASVSYTHLTLPTILLV